MNYDAWKAIEKINAERLKKRIKSIAQCSCGGVRLEVTDDVFECMACGRNDLDINGKYIHLNNK